MTMTRKDAIKSIMAGYGWFKEKGLYVLVDGQFGSTGKGLIAGLIGEMFAKELQLVTTNAGPNSGHTGYLNGVKVQTQQIPVAAVTANQSGGEPTTYLNAGAIIDIDQLFRERQKYLLRDGSMDVSWPIIVHPHAVIISEDDKRGVNSTRSIASTGKGVGEAMARKVLRDKTAVALYPSNFERLVKRGFWVHEFEGVENKITFVETAQGFSLGLNSGMYPYTTSRECTVGQAISDLGAHPAHLRKTIMTLRTYPIRVGNTEQGQSGPGYIDQQEVTWGEIGVEPEFTTVTKRVRRVFTFSWMQYRAALRANRPDVLFANFLQYLPGEAAQREFVKSLLMAYEEELGSTPELILGGYGKYPEDIQVEYTR